MLDAVEREKSLIERDYLANKTSLENAISHDKIYLKKGGKDFAKHYDAVIAGYNKINGLKSQFDSDMSELINIQKLASNNKSKLLHDAVLDYNNFSKGDKLYSEYNGIRKIEAARVLHISNVRYFNSPVNTAVVDVQSAVDNLKVIRSKNDRKQICHTSFATS